MSHGLTPGMGVSLVTGGGACFRCDQCCRFTHGQVRTQCGACARGDGMNGVGAKRDESAVGRDLLCVAIKGHALCCLW